MTYPILGNYFPSTYQKYVPQAFDNSLDLYEQMTAVISFLNQIADNFNSLSHTTQGDLTTVAEVVNTLNDSLETFKSNLENEVLPTNLVAILEEWLNNGTLADILTTELLDNKANVTDLTALQGQLDNKANVTDLTALQGQLAQIVTNVKDYGAKGDGVTDDTGAIQAAINAVSGQNNATVLFPPTPGSYYLVNTLEIPDNTHILRFLGLGYAKICYTGQVGFRVKSEMFTVDNMIIWSINPAAESDGTMFLDARTYKRLDFDIHLKNSTFSYASKLVVAWGRGVNIEGCNMNNITHQIIKINYHPREQIEEGPYDIQKYNTGYRGWVLRNNRFHYCTAVAFDNTADIDRVGTSFLMTGNQIEGGLGYFAGYCRDGVFTGNLHYHIYENRDSLFRFTGTENVTIDVNISGMSNAVHGYTKRFARLAEFFGAVNNLRISGNIQNVMKNVFTFYENATNVLIDVNVQDFVPPTNFNVSYVFFAEGPKAYKNVRINGSVEMNSPGGDVVQKYDLLSTFTNVQVNTLASGQYRNLTNLDAV